MVTLLLSDFLEELPFHSFPELFIVHVTFWVTSDCTKLKNVKIWRECFYLWMELCHWNKNLFLATWESDSIPFLGFNKQDHPFSHLHTYTRVPSPKTHHLQEVLGKSFQRWKFKDKNWWSFRKAWKWCLQAWKKKKKKNSKFQLLLILQKHFLT